MVIAMLSESRIRELLAPFGVDLNSCQINQLNTYLTLLLRWNERINLTSVQSAEECVTRHFGESLFIAEHEELKGQLLDVGSGAGFPGLALKIVFPCLSTTLLEPLAKKRAFLKEVIRACEFEEVEIRPERLDRFAASERGFNSITMRAVGGLKERLAEAWKILEEEGKIYLWLSRVQGKELKELLTWIRWLDLPLSRDRGILTGDKMKTVRRST